MGRPGPAVMLTTTRKAARSVRPVQRQSVRVLPERVMMSNSATLAARRAAPCRGAALRRNAQSGAARPRAATRGA